MNHDGSYKRLFTHREMVADLLKGFIKQPWVEQCDFSTLEKRNSSFVSDKLKQRSDDLVWRIRCGDEYIYVYLLLEFQSTVDHYMVVRIMTYVGLLYQELLDTLEVTRNQLLPPVLPIVLYNGSSLWTAPFQLGTLIHPAPMGLESYRPQISYLLLDEQRYHTAELLDLKNLVAAVFELEQSQMPEDLIRVTRLLMEWLNSPEQTNVMRSFAVWITQIIRQTKLPGLSVNIEALNRVEDLKGVCTMLEATMTKWTQDWKNAGLVEGRVEGEQREATKILLRMLEKKFGAVSQDLRVTIQNADLEQTEAWLDNILQAESPEDLINRSH